MAKESWWFLASSMMNTVAGGVIGVKAAGADDDLPQEVFIGAIAAFAVNTALSTAAAYFWSRGNPNRFCNPNTLGAALTVITAAAGFTAGDLAYSNCNGSFTCLQAAAAWAAALGVHVIHGVGLLCSDPSKPLVYQSLNAGDM